MSVVRRRVFPEAFKREAVQRVATSGLSAGRVSAELGVHETVLRRWMAQFAPASEVMPARDAISASRPISAMALSASRDLAAENAILRRENEQLRADRDTLKKALAIVFAELK
jgi:transposase